MARTPPRADSLLAQVRTYFGLLQWELAGYLEVPEALYPHLEADRRGFGSAYRSA